MNVTWTIEKIKCDGCARSIAEALLMIDGIKDLAVEVETKTLHFIADDQAAADQARKALVRAGFPPKA